MRRAVALAVAGLFLAVAAPAAGHSVMKIENGTIFYNATDDVALNRLSITIRPSDRAGAGRPQFGRVARRSDRSQTRALVQDEAESTAELNPAAEEP